MTHLFIILQHWHPIWPAVSWSCGGTLTKTLNFNHTDTLSNKHHRLNLKRQNFIYLYRLQRVSFSHQCRLIKERLQLDPQPLVCTHTLWQSPRLLLIGQFTTSDMWVVFKWGLSLEDFTSSVKFLLCPWSRRCLDARMKTLSAWSTDKDVIAIHHCCVYVCVSVCRRVCVYTGLDWSDLFSPGGVFL